MCVHTGHTPGRPPVITDTPWLSWEPNTEGLWLRMELSVSPIVPKTTCDTRGRGDTDRTGTKGQQWAYCPERAWYNPTATEWYQAKTTALIQFHSEFLCAAAGWWGGRTIMEALFPYNHPSTTSVSLRFTSGDVCPHTSESQITTHPHRSSLRKKREQSRKNSPRT